METTALRLRLYGLRFAVQGFRVRMENMTWILGAYRDTEFFGLGAARFFVIRRNSGMQKENAILNPKSWTLNLNWESCRGFWRDPFLHFLLATSKVRSSGLGQGLFPKKGMWEMYTGKQRRREFRVGKETNRINWVA